MAEGGSRLKLSKLGTVMEVLSPLGEDPPVVDPESDGIWKPPGCAAAAAACDSILPIASYMGLLKSRFPSEVTSFNPNSGLVCNMKFVENYRYLE